MNTLYRIHFTAYTLYNTHLGKKKSGRNVFALAGKWAMPVFGKLGILGAFRGEKKEPSNTS